MMNQSVMDTSFDRSAIALLEHLPAPCLLLDSEVRVEFWNRAAQQTFGFSLEQVRGKSPLDFLIPPGARQKFMAKLQPKGFSPPHQFEVENLTRDGRVVICEWSQKQVRDGQGQLSGLLVVIRDLTAERQTIESARQQMQRMRALRTIDDAIMDGVGFQPVLNLVLFQAMTQLGMDAAVILTIDPSTGDLKFASGRGLRTDALRFTSLRVGQGYAGQAALERRVVHIPDLGAGTTHFSRSPMFHQEEFRTYMGLPLIVKGEVKGVLESFYRTPFQPGSEWLDFFNRLGSHAATALDNASLFMNLRRSASELELAYDATLEGWSKALDLRDKHAEGHAQRVAQMTDQLAVAMGIKETERTGLRRGALLHDIGKLGIPDRILLKPGPLTGEEWTIMREHPTVAVELLSPISYLRPALDIPHYHHEKWDGSGYPAGLRGAEIPLAARLFAVVDVFDALTSDRPYRRAWSKDQALDHIRAESGRHFDPSVVDAFLGIVPGLGQAAAI